MKIKLLWKWLEKNYSLIWHKECDACMYNKKKFHKLIKYLNRYGDKNGI